MACLRGILYFSEDVNNTVIGGSILYITKYAIRCFQDYNRYALLNFFVLFFVFYLFWGRGFTPSNSMVFLLCSILQLH